MKNCVGMVVAAIGLGMLILLAASSVDAFAGATVPDHSQSSQGVFETLGPSSQPDRLLHGRRWFRAKVCPRQHFRVAGTFQVYVGASIYRKGMNVYVDQKIENAA